MQVGSREVLRKRRLTMVDAHGLQQFIFPGR